MDIDKIINISQERASLLLNIPTAYEEDTLKVEKVLKDNDFFDGDDLSEENLDKLIKFINANKEFIINKKN